MDETNSIKVNIYGDSIMRGTVIDDNLRFHSVIPTFLGKLTDRFDISFKNRAHFGITIERGAKIVEKDIAKGLDCDYALIEFGGNDCSFQWAEVSEAPGRDHQPFTPLERFTATYTDMVVKLKEAGTTPVMMTLPPIDAGRHLRYLEKMGNNAANILKWLGDVHMIYRFHELYSNAISQIAAKTNTLLVDTRARFLDKHNLLELVGLDGVHPSEQGYHVLWEAFDSFICNRRTANRYALAAT